MNLGKKIKKNLSGNLSSKISAQKSWHQRNNIHMYNSIAVSLSYYRHEPYIMAALWTDGENHDAYSSVKTISFFKRAIDSFVEGMNQITFEVSKAINSHPELYYFRSTCLMKDDLKEYLTRLKSGGDALRSPRIEEIFKNGCTNSWGNRKKTTNIYEIYSNGSWSITDKEFWFEHQSGFDLD